MLCRACSCKCVVGGCCVLLYSYYSVFNMILSLNCLLNANSLCTNRRQTMATDTLSGFFLPLSVYVGLHLFSLIDTFNCLVVEK